MTNESEIMISSSNNDNTYSYPSRKNSSFHPNNMIQESEFLSAARKDTFLFRLLKFYNQVYRVGFDIMYFILLLCTLAMAPLFGAVVAMVDFFCALIRMLIRPVGKTVADLFGYGTFLRARTIQIQRELVV